ncbi:MAG: BirA family transcriptional regulator [Verrucomicrobiota bacterium]|jgi:BirA family biotin operon repressor/biotin-[acetyl-CoA-carboxylase] ligase
MTQLDAERIRTALGQCVIGREIVVLEQTTSTNDAIFQKTTPDVPEGLVVFAEQQTAGRGQRGHDWESVGGLGLWLSILLRPKISLDQSARLTDWAARVISKTILEEFEIAPHIKPPNDIYLADRKIAGVLVEMRAQKNGPHVAIVGIGINVNQMPEDFSEAVRSRAGSLAMALGRPQDRYTLAVALLRNLDRTYPDLAG